jgi:hypothetical protein
LEKSDFKIREIKIPATPETGLLVPKKQGQAHLGSEATNRPAASPTL